MEYGIELEFFVKKGKVIVPAYLYTNNLDGNILLGELRTGIHKNITDAIFELKKLIYLEEIALKKKKCKFVLVSEHLFESKEISEVRTNPNYGNKNFTKEFSIYSENFTPKIYTPERIKASLQINFSENIYKKIRTIKNSIESYEESVNSSLFNFPEIIRKLDNKFKEEIKNTERTSGIYTIKDGEKGKRLEYRSLPNTINLSKLLLSF